jgi:hypothetical protein
MKYLLIKLIFINLLLASGLIHASTGQLLANNELQIKTWISPDDGLVKGQQILLQVEVSTTQNWQGNLAIEHVEMKDSIILQREKFAVNTVRNEQGKRWLVQVWSLVVYPQRSGSFVLPDFSINLGLIDADGKISRGDIKAPGLKFVVKKNEGISDDIKWIASPRFSIDDEFDKPLEDLLPGDAFVRTLKFSAEDLPSMMLPKMVVKDIKGISLYTRPAQLVDKVNRGDYLAQRTEQLTYVMQDSGEFTLPEQVFYWWDTRENSLKEIRLPEYIVKVKRLSLLSLLTWPVMIGLVIALSLLLLVIKLVLAKRELLRAYWLKFKGRVNARLNPPEKDLKRRFRRACVQGEFEHALALLYQGLDTYEKGFNGVLRGYLQEFDNVELQQKFEVLLGRIYAVRNSEILQVEMLEIIQGISIEIRKNKNIKNRWFRKVELKLN